MPAWRRSKCTICGLLPTTGTAPWMTAPSAAARAWSSSRNRSLNVWRRWAWPPANERAAAKQSVILLSAQGRRFDQATAQELSALQRIVLICGRYEGVDERVGQHLSRSRAVHRRLCPERRRIGRGSHCRRRHPADSRGAGQRGLHAAGVVQHACGIAAGGGAEFHLRFRRIARLSALHAARRSFAAWRCRKC